MTLAAGTRLGPYEVVAQIGMGGMGEVYRATDTNLKRAVAIKVLPASVAADAERLARFQREAEVLASLNHPHIAQIHGLEKSNGIVALVMELVEGPTLADRIAQGAIPIDEALPIAKQIAEALEAAHEQGVIHRDLKPANIKVRPDGTVKVLDFGLAKALAPPAGSAEASPYGWSQSPTITSPAMMTGVGMILGTAAYMSPEQARGKTVDKRSDIWAFGCVLYEMLTGQRAFPSDDVQDTFVAIMRDEPDWARLPATLSPALSTSVRRCLQKNPKQRIADAQDIRLALEGAFESVTQSAATATWDRRVAIIGATALLFGAVVTGAVALFVLRPPGRLPPPRVSRLLIAPSGNSALTINGIMPDVALTSDGSRLIYVGNRGTQLFVRPLDTLVPLAVFTGLPQGPFVSPDNEWIGFLDVANDLKKVAMTGGPAVTLTRLSGGLRGATWGPDDAIIFASADVNTGLQRIAPTGGTPIVLTRPDHGRGEGDHVWPELLPGGRAVIFTITASTGGPDAAQVAVLDLQTGKTTVLVRGGGQAHYASSGHLVHAAAGTLRAVPFDLATLKTTGTPVPVISDVVMTEGGVGGGVVDAVVAGDGTLAYVSDAGAISTQRTLVWVGRHGEETPIPAPPHAYAYPRLSPDGTRIAVWAQDQESDLWLWDLARGTFTRVTFEPGLDRTPLWAPDGRRLLFSSDRLGAQNLFIQTTDGTAPATRLAQSAFQQIPTGITNDGTRVVFHEQTPNRQRDLWLLNSTPTPRVEPLLQTPFEERGGIVSPDGRWLAYESNSSGVFEVYVRPFPNVGDGQWQVSTDGGVQPLWARSGRELFYRTPEGVLLTVPVVGREDIWGAGKATELVAGRYFVGSNLVSRQYDVASDGQRFVMIKESGGANETIASPQLIIVQHFDEELKRLVPTK